LYEQIIDSMLATSAEVVLFGANYDDALTPCPFFREHIMPWLNRAADKLHGAGKYLLTHTDGENKGLMPAFADCRFDIADSVCPAPMTKVSLREYRDLFGKRITLWGGVPSTLVLPSCFSEEDFRRFVQELVRDCKPYDHLILSVADTLPPDADFGRIQYLADVCRKTAS
jgi:uroporphyrinogen-III decarboxylase